MNLDSLHNAATEVTGLLTSLVQSAPDLSGIWPAMGADDPTGMMMPALAGIAAAVTVALAVSIYFQTGYRSYRDMIRHGLAAAIGLSMLAFVAYDMRNAALAYIVRTSQPATEFELRWQQTTERAKALVAEMERTAHTSPEAHAGVHQG